MVVRLADGLQLFPICRVPLPEVSAACVVGWGEQGLRKVTAEKNQELPAAEAVAQPRVMASALQLPLLSLMVGA